MKQILFLATIFSISSFSQQNITMDVGDFNSLTIYDGIKVELKKSQTNSVEITGNNSASTIVKNKNGSLKIRLNLEKKFSGETNVVLNYKDLYRITTHEGAYVFSKDTIAQHELNIKAHTGSKQDYIINTTFLNTTSATGSSIVLNGSSKYHDVTAMSGSKVFAVSLLNEETTATSSTGAVIDLSAVKEIEATVKAGGIINIHTKTEKIIKKVIFGGSVNLLYE